MTGRRFDRKSSRRGRRTKRQSIGISVWFKGMLGPWLRRSAPVLLMTVVLSLVGLGVSRSLHAAGPFRPVTFLIMSRGAHVAPMTIDLPYEGDIFGVELAWVYQQVSQHYLAYEDLQVERVLPNRVLIHGTKRRAIAQIRSGRYFPVDEAGFLLPDVANVPQEGLPILTDDSWRVTDSEIGQIVQRDGIQQSIGLLQTALRMGAEAPFRIYEVDMTSPNNLVFFLEGGVEVRVGGAPFEEKLRELTRTQREFDIDHRRIRYIDLRFDDVVLGPR